jgi:hypothetical protein
MHLAEMLTGLILLLLGAFVLLVAVLIVRRMLRRRTRTRRALLPTPDPSPTSTSPPSHSWGRLVVEAGPEAGRVFELRQASIAIGRDVTHAQDVRLAKDDFISRRHGLLERAGNTVYYTDSGSKHGTRIGAAAVAPARRTAVASGARLHLGPHTIVRLELVGATPRLPAKTRIDHPADELPTEYLELPTEHLTPAPATPVTHCLRCGAPRPAAAGPLCPACEIATIIHRETVPGYRCLSKLHEGMICTVWLAEDTRTGGRVAVKLFQPPADVHAQAELIFRRECALSLDLAHPNIVRFLATGDYQGQLYIVMEYIDGHDAQDLLYAAGGTLPPRDVVAIARQTLEALDHAHGRGIVHRDIKPSNLLVSGTAPDYRVKVTDFGIARVYRAARISGITRVTDVRGTPWFMPPEQAINCRGVDHRADLFSLGATIYHLLTGQFVYNFPPGPDPRRFLNHILEKQVVPIAARGLTLPPTLTALVTRAIKIDPNVRFQSAREMRNALDSLSL